METDGADKTTALEKLFEVGIVKKGSICYGEVIFVFIFFRIFFVIDRLKFPIPKFRIKIDAFPSPQSRTLQNLRLFFVSVSWGEAPGECKKRHMAGQGEEAKKNLSVLQRCNNDFLYEKHDKLHYDFSFLQMEMKKEWKSC